MASPSTLRNIWRVLKIIIFIAFSFVGKISTDVLTFPYYRFYRQNTLLPILAIARSVTSLKSPGPDPARSVDESTVLGELKRWRQRKLDEFRLVQVASTLLSAAVIGCFSWNVTAENQHWIGPASWHASLVLSTFAILLASSESFIFNTIQNAEGRRCLEKELRMILSVNEDECEDGAGGSEGGRGEDLESGRAERRGCVGGVHVDAAGSRVEDEAVGVAKELAGSTSPPGLASWLPTKMPRVGIRWNMVFTWQAPMMLMAYSVVAFLVGLTVFVCTPLYDGQGSEYERSIAILYLVSFVCSGGTFLWCSVWAYRFVDLAAP